MRTLSPFERPRNTAPATTSGKSAAARSERTLPAMRANENAGRRCKHFVGTKLASMPIRKRPLTFFLMALATARETILNMCSIRKITRHLRAQI